MAPRHTQGCGGAACLATALFLVQQTKNWCVGFSFPPPAYAGIHPTLYLFGFRADALNSHSPPSLPGFDQGLASAGAFWTFLGLFPDWGSGASGGLRGPPGSSGGLWGPPPPVRMLGLVVGFASALTWQILEYRHFQASSSIGLARGAPKTTPRRPPEAKVAGFRVTNNLVNHSKGERSPRRGSCPSTWRCSSRSTNSLGLHSSSKRWCE